MRDDLKGVKVGDQISFHHGSQWVPFIRKVVKVSKAQVVDDEGNRWQMNGRRVGAGAWSQISMAWPTTDLDRAIVAHHNVGTKLAKLIQKEAMVSHRPEGARYDEARPVREMIESTARLRAAWEAMTATEIDRTKLRSAEIQILAELDTEKKS